MPHPGPSSLLFLGVGGCQSSAADGPSPDDLPLCPCNDVTPLLDPKRVLSLKAQQSVVWMPEEEPRFNPASFSSFYFFYTAIHYPGDGF